MNATVNDRDKLGRFNMTATYFRISLASFIMLWLAAMNYLSLFDAAMLFVVVACVNLGIATGILRELVASLRLVTIFAVSLYCYPYLYTWSDFNFGMSNAVWVEVSWFLTVLVLLWVVTRILLISWEQQLECSACTKKIYRLLGCFVGIFKGAFSAYALAFIVSLTTLSLPSPLVVNGYLFSYTYQIVNVLDNHYPLIDRLDTKELAKRTHDQHTQYHINRVSAMLFKDDPHIQLKVIEFLLWLDSKPNYIARLHASKEVQRFWHELAQVKAVPIWIASKPEIKRFARLNQTLGASVLHLCQILGNPELAELTKHDKIKEQALLLNTVKIKAELEQSN